MTVALLGWKLTLPVSNGRGGAAIVDPARVSPPFLSTDDTGGLAFWAPVDGATTPHSRHARTELNARDTFRAGAGRSALHAAVTVRRVPETRGDVILGQIHGAGDLISVPFVMLHWADGTVRVVVKQQRTGSAARTFPLLRDVPLGTGFTFSLADGGDGTLTFGATCAGDRAAASAPLPAAFAGAPVRFQAGAYQLGAVGTPGDGVRVTFSALATGH